MFVDEEKMKKEVDKIVGQDLEKGKFARAGDLGDLDIKGGKKLKTQGTTSLADLMGSDMAGGLCPCFGLSVEKKVRERARAGRAGAGRWFDSMPRPGRVPSKSARQCCH